MSDITINQPAPRADLAFVFPGQGSQAVGMLAELGAAFPEVRKTFDEASEGAGFDLWALSQDGPEAELGKTENTQPALLAASVATWRTWLAQGGAVPAQVAGHSLGEYSALVCAGALPLREAAALVAERGRLMQAAVPAGVGSMAAVLGAEDELIQQVCKEVSGEEVVTPANYNSPGQLVIAGHAGAVDRAAQRLGELGVRKVIKLQVSVPSHTPLMRDAAQQLAARMAELPWQVPTIPVLQNADAKAHVGIEFIRAALERQLYMPVLWTDTVQSLVRNGAAKIFECGPGKVLAGLCKRIDKAIDARALGTPAEMAQALADVSN
ncbi:MAG: ACP S-malonyltransferase [Xanthomonadales bacterium]|nr:ACP S-malonyltransferase [Xanthomonadales bacterium]ODU93570.1 MAG: [acyl-carrier-protein] S-malonyltransferase [Rhodanobacter sp. SCN 66-43]OJY86667.1 MAG: [acyl-carrier-protein] S-malonyltransferase [Xanthomonadales bacterium 66-474]